MASKFLKSKGSTGSTGSTSVAMTVVEGKKVGTGHNRHYSKMTIHIKRAPSAQQQEQQITVGIRQAAVLELAAAAASGSLGKVVA
eukprot:scaffold363476_cov96-Cyclotella_meneghiniana.AAC.4